MIIARRVDGPVPFDVTTMLVGVHVARSLILHGYLRCLRLLDSCWYISTAHEFGTGAGLASC
jgi:hypothetical protein